ncbi:MAG: hypothetical protein IPM50_07285 [Acidobacteriota bacterium]|nr:MAG: hypothetical protein IPM50_07285 [Acidobacteriota bacterium]
MKHLAFGLILVFAVTLTAFLSSSTSSSAQINNPSVLNPAMGNEAMMKRIQDLEKKVDQLQKEMAGAKLVVSGLDKNLTSLKSAHETHTHRMSASLSNWTTIEQANKSGQGPLIPVLYKNQYESQQGPKGIYTTAPVPATK